jgi:hypothetical protein
MGTIVIDDPLPSPEESLESAAYSGSEQEATADAQQPAREAEKVWTGKVGQYDVQLHIKDGRGDPNAVRVRLRHYETGDQSNLNNWYIPNPSDGRNWTNYDWSVFGHEVGHDLLGFPGNMEPPGMMRSVMGRRLGAGPAFAVSVFDIKLLLDSLRVFHAKWETCGCK